MTVKYKCNSCGEMYDSFDVKVVLITDENGVSGIDPDSKYHICAGPGTRDCFEDFKQSFTK